MTFLQCEKKTAVQYYICLPSITLSAIEVQVSRISDGFSVKHSLQVESRPKRAKKASVLS